MKSNFTKDMEDVADFCGEDAVYHLIERLPGIMLYVPKKLTENNPISKLDPYIASQLIEEFGGGAISIPSARRSKEETSKEIERLVEKGLTTQQIALQLGVTQAYVFQVRRQFGMTKIAQLRDPRQMQLFSGD